MTPAATPTPTRPLQPALMDDELLFHDWEADDEEMAEAAAQGAGAAGSPAVAAASGGAAAAASPAEVAALRAENEALRGMLEAMRAVVLADDGMRELAAEAAQQRAGGGSGSAGEASTSAAAAAAAPAQEDEEAKRIDESYFDSYSTFDIHREMLADKVGWRGGVVMAAGGQVLGEQHGMAWQPLCPPLVLHWMASVSACACSWLPAASLPAAARPSSPALAGRPLPQVRTEAYREALEKNPSLMQGARVLDVGCGTGILSMCAARGGATAVVGIDGSEQVGPGGPAGAVGAHGSLNLRCAAAAALCRPAMCLSLCPQPPVSLPPCHQIAKYARANVEANNLAGRVTIVSSKVEELGALPQLAAGGEREEGQQHAAAGPAGQQQVDVLVSEWMGYALLFESMLGSVLHARDRWLRPGGAVLPDVANIYVAAAGAGASGLGFWTDVYGFRCVGSCWSSQLAERAQHLGRNSAAPRSSPNSWGSPGCLQPASEESCPFVRPPNSHPSSPLPLQHGGGA